MSIARITPIPILLCGKLSRMATSVTAGLLPEIEVVHVFLNRETFIADAPVILKTRSGDGNNNEDLQKLAKQGNIGSQDYSKPILAILSGGGYGDEDVLAMRGAITGAGLRGVAWVRPDVTKKDRVSPGGPEYEKFVVRSVKERLAELRDEGKLERSEVYYY